MDTQNIMRKISKKSKKISSAGKGPVYVYKNAQNNFLQQICNNGRYTLVTYAIQRKSDACVARTVVDLIKPL